MVRLNAGIWECWYMIIMGMLVYGNDNMGAGEVRLNACIDKPRYVRTYT